MSYGQDFSRIVQIMDSGVQLLTQFLRIWAEIGVLDWHCICYVRCKEIC